MRSNSRRCAPNDARHALGAPKSFSKTVTFGRAVMGGVFTVPPEQVVGVPDSSPDKVLQSGVGTNAPMQYSCDSDCDRPVAFCAAE